MAGQGVGGEAGSWERRHKMERGNRTDLGRGAQRYRTKHALTVMAKTVGLSVR